MADVKWTGEATAVAQVDTFTPGGTIEADDVFILTITGWDGTSTAISAAAGGTTVADVTAAMTAAWNASTHALCTPITAADNTTNLTLTADTAGEAFSVAATTTEAGGGAADAQTFVKASTTASAGPKHWDSTGNWDTGALPGASAGDEVFISNCSDDIVYGLDQSGTANTLTTLNIDKSFTGKIGYNGEAGFSGTYLQVKATTVNIGQHIGSGSPAGSGRIMIDVGSAGTPVINIYNTSSSSADTNKPCVRVKANNASAVCNISDGMVGFAYEDGETTTIGTIRMSGGEEVYISEGTTVTTVYKKGGNCDMVCGCTTLTNDGGALSLYGSGTYTTINQKAGTCYLYGTGTITTLNVTGGFADCRKSLDSRTITTVKVKGGSFHYDPTFLTLTNQIQSYETEGDQAVTIN